MWKKDKEEGTLYPCNFESEKAQGILKHMKEMHIENKVKNETGKAEKENNIDEQVREKTDDGVNVPEENQSESETKKHLNTKTQEGEKESSGYNEETPDEKNVETENDINVIDKAREKGTKVTPDAELQC